MVSDTSLLDSANQLLDRHWRRWRRHTDSEGAAVVSSAELRVLESILTDLVDVVSRCPHQPVDKLESMVHRLLHERSFTDHGGDAVGATLSQSDWQCRFDAQVKIIMHVLAAVREEGLARGSWSGYEAPPPMAG